MIGSSTPRGATNAPTIEAVVRELVRDAVAEALREQAVRESPPLRNSGEVYISVAKAARTVDVAPGTVRAWIRSGRLEAKRAGRVLRISRAELERFIAGAPGKAQQVETQRRAAKLLGRRP